MAAHARRRAPRILVIDVGGTHVKAGFPNEARRIRIPSGPSMGPVKMVRKLKERLHGKRYSVVSIGYPGLVVHGRILREPRNLGKGWVAFDFPKALGHPVRILNDAAMQALGSYEGGRMLFLGLGTGLGTAMIVDGRLEPMELAHLPYKKGGTFEDFVGEAARKRLGRKRWQKEVFAIVRKLSAVLEPDYVVLGGGNLRRLKSLPPGSRRGNNRNAFVGGERLWKARGGTPLAEVERVKPSRSGSPRPRSRKVARRAIAAPR
ncbi:MAG: ROK family protein [Thermoplasmata archaeon]|nr:ROK family protein [Thermoplasmata archaeon]